MENALAINLRTLEPTKPNIKLLAETIIVAVQDGELDPLETIVKLTAIGKLADSVREGIHENILQQLDKYPKNKAVIFGADVAQKETGVKYDYSQTSEWVNLKKQEEYWKEKRENLEKMLKVIPAHTVQADPDSGAMWDLYPAAKSSKTSFAITLEK